MQPDARRNRDGHTITNLELGEPIDVGDPGVRHGERDHDDAPESDDRFDAECYALTDTDSQSQLPHYAGQLGEIPVRILLDCASTNNIISSALIE